MIKFSRSARIFLFISVLSGSLWIGAYLTRLFLTYQLFEAENLSLKSIISQDSLTTVFYVLLPAITTTFVLYIVFIFSFIIFLFLSKLSFKQNGWLFITALIIFLTMPFEVYLMTIDYYLITQLNSATFNAGEVLSLIMERIKVLSSFLLVEIFCYISIYYFILFKPLTSKNKLAA